MEIQGRQSGDVSHLRRLNSAAVLSVLREAGDATVSELARAARVSRPTAEAIVDGLLDDGWAEECEAEQGDRQRGRPARRYRFRAAAGHVVGVGIGRSGLRAMVSDLAGDLVAVRAQPLPAGTAAPERLAAVVDLVSAAATGAGVAVRDLVAVGVGTTGVVDGAGRVVKSVALPGWTGLRLQEELADRLPVPVVAVENDMRLAVLAEHWRGAAQGCDDVVYLFAADRIGMGLLIGGRPYRGAHAASGEIGRQPNDHWAVFRAVNDYAMSVEPGELRSSGQSAEFAIARARGGDERALRAVTDFARALAAGLVTVVNPLDPELVVIGGSLASAGDLLVRPVQEVVDEYCLYPPRVVASLLGGECITLGAVRLALDHAERLLFTLPG